MSQFAGGIICIAIGVALLVFRNRFPEDLTKFHKYGERQLHMARTVLYTAAAFAIIFGMLLITGIAHMR